MDGKMAAEGNAEAVAGESVATACDGSKCNFVQVVDDKVICRQSGSAFSYSPVKSRIIVLFSFI